MTLSERYKQGQATARQLEHKIIDMLDDRSHQLAQQLLRDAQDIEDHFQTQKNPRSIEHRITRFLNQFEELKRYETPVMDATHARWLHDQYEELGRSLRAYDNY